MMDKMFFTLRQMITYAMKKHITHQKVIVPYATIITKMAKTMSSWNPKYELFPIAVTYNLSLIGKIRYKKNRW